MLINLLVSASSGKDQICRLLQYNAQLCSLIVKSQETKNQTIATVCDHLETAVRRGREIFNLLKLFDHIGILKKILMNKKNNPTIALSLASTVCSAIACFSNNMMFASHIGSLSKIVSSKNIPLWKYRKDIFLFIKVVLNIIESGILFRISNRFEIH